MRRLLNIPIFLFAALLVLLGTHETSAQNWDLSTNYKAGEGTEMWPLAKRPTKQHELGYYHKIWRINNCQVRFGDTIKHPFGDPGEQRISIMCTREAAIAKYDDGDGPKDQTIDIGDDTTEVESLALLEHSRNPRPGYPTLLSANFQSATARKLLMVLTVDGGNATVIGDPTDDQLFNGYLLLSLIHI